ncbi:hypothetical protein PFISCL1PPCAC_7634, partial [Pristionchus fissidentatus]
TTTPQEQSIQNISLVSYKYVLATTSHAPRRTTTKGSTTTRIPTSRMTTVTSSTTASTIPSTTSVSPAFPHFLTSMCLLALSAML